MSIGWIHVRRESFNRNLLRYLPAALLSILFIFVYFVTTPRHITGTADSARYLVGGSNIASGQLPLVFKGDSYIGYIALIAASFSVGAGVYGVVLVQLLIGVLACFAIADLGRSMGGRWAGVAAALLLIGDGLLARRGFQIMTDYTYALTIILLVWAVYRATEKGGFAILLCLPVLVLASTLRPNGVVLVPIVVFYWIQRTIKDRRWRWALIAVTGVIFVLLEVLPSPLHSAVAAEDPLKMFRNGVTLWGQTYWRVTMPPDDVLRQSNWSGLFLYMVRHPVASAWLMLARLLIHFSNLRLNVPLTTNITSSIWLLGVYSLAVIGMIRARRHPLAWLCLAIIVAHAGIVALTFTLQPGRFLFHVLPLFYLLAGVGVGQPGVPAQSLRWRAVQLGTVGIVIVRIVSAASIEHGWSLIAFGGPSASDASLETATVGQNLALEGVNLVEAPVRPGEQRDITFYWRADGQIPANYAASIQLVDESGALVGTTTNWIGGDFYLQDDFEGGHPYSTSTWPAGLHMVDRYTIQIPEDAPHTLKIYLAVLMGKKQNPVDIVSTGGQPVSEHRMLVQTIEVSP